MTDAIDNIIRIEGGYVNDPADRGGPTKYGITQKTLSDYLGRQASIEDVKNITKETAREIYERHYLTGPRINTLPSPIQEQILDIGVNSGPKTAIKMLQRVLNAAGFGPVTVDGVIGPMTRNVTETALQKMGPYLSNAIVDHRIQFYEHLAERHPSDKKFLKGWKRRANSFRLPT